MSNDFLNSYKKKAEEEFGGESPMQTPPVAPKASTPPPTQGGSAPTPPPAPKLQGQQPQVLPVVAPQNSMSFEQSSTFKKPSSSGPPSRFTKGNDKKFPLKYIIVGVVAVATIIIIIVLLSRGIAVPSMVGWTQSDAELWGRENEVLLRVTEEYIDNIPAGEIISQTPPEGQEVAGGDFIELVVSLGPDPDVEVLIPDIMNMTIDEVEEWAEQNLMTAVRIVTEESETVEVGKVIEFSVNDNTVLGDTINRDTPFYVVFSKGKGEGEAVEVPNFLTMSTEEADKFGLDNDIVLIKKEVFHDTIAEGQIISQSVKADETVHTGDTIELEISKGKEIIVPNFFQYDEERAAAEATRLGIKTIVVERYGASDEGDLMSQSIPGGTLYDGESIVELVYSLGNSFVLPSFVGKTEPDIREWITPKNDLGAAITLNTTFTASEEPPGTVLSQDKIDYTISYTGGFSIVVSSGPVIYVPNFVSTPTTREMAITMCDALGIVAVFVEESNSSVAPGMIWSQSAGAGTEIKQGANITLKYNPMGNITLPDFTDTTLWGTQAKIESSVYASQLIIVFTTVTDDTKDAGTVTAQSHTAGTTLPPGTTVTITVTMKTPTTPTP